MDTQKVFPLVVFAILAVDWLIQIFFKKFSRKIASRVFLYSATLVFVYLIYTTFIQFRAFRAGPLGLIIGTKSGLLWFFNYVSLHFLNEYIASFVVAILFALIAKYFNKKYKERFFENEELYLIALGILLVGYPGFLFYITAMLIIPTIVSTVLVKKGERLPLYYFWLPTAIATFLIAHLWAVNQLWWALFKFSYS